MSSLNRKRSTMKIKLRYIILMISVLMVSIYAVTDTIKAASFNYPGITENRYNVVEKLDTYYPDLDSYPFDEENVVSVGLTDLWGSSKGLSKYLGEVPETLADKGEGKKLRTLNSTKIDGKERPWSKHSGLKEDDLKPSSSDLHIKAMAEASGSGAGTIGWLLYYIVAGVNFLVTALLSLLLKLKDLDMDMILDTLNSGDKLRETVNTLFLISPDGDVSPFLMIMLVLFAASLVGVVYKALKGDTVLEHALKELGFLLLAALIAGITLTSSGQVDLAKWSVNLATTMSNEVVSSSTEGSELFKYDTGNSTKDSNMTQAALLDKPHVDSFINMQFGYTTADLAIKNKNGVYTKNFGKDTALAIEETFGDERDFSINTGSGKVHNLGYYWWAANSNVDENSPVKGKGDVKGASNQRYLYIVDFLNNARVHAEANGEKEVVNKIDKIMSKMWDPDWMSGFFTSLMLVILKVALLYAFYLIIIFMSIGKIIISVGSFAVAILSALLLVPKTRAMAKKLLSTYIMGFVRYIVGLIMINLVISIVASLAGQGVGGVLIASVIAVLLGKFIPNILLEINRHVAKHDAPFMNGMNRSFAKYSNSVKTNRVRSNTSRIEYDENGNLVNKDKSISGRIASGLSRGKGTGNNEDGSEKITGNDNSKVKGNSQNIDNEEKELIDKDDVSTPTNDTPTGSTPTEDTPKDTTGDNDESRDSITDIPKDGESTETSEIEDAEDSDSDELDRGRNNNNHYTSSDGLEEPDAEKLGDKDSNTKGNDETDASNPYQNKDNPEPNIYSSNEDDIKTDKEVDDDRDKPRPVRVRVNAGHNDPNINTTDTDRLENEDSSVDNPVDDSPTEREESTKRPNVGNIDRGMEREAVPSTPETPGNVNDSAKVPPIKDVKKNIKINNKDNQKDKEVDTLPEDPPESKRDNKNKGKNSFVKRKAKNIGLGMAQKTIGGRKIVESMQRNQKQEDSSSSNNKDDED